MEEREYYWVDIESGVRFKCSKEFYETMRATWIAATPAKLCNKKFGSMMIFGTGGKIDKKGKFLSEDEIKRLNQNKDE